MPTNDNTPVMPPLEFQMPDPHGQAALLLVESVIHGLLASSVITVDDAIEIVEIADSVQVDVAEAADGAGAPMWQAHALLSAITRSLMTDVHGGPKPLHLVP